LEGSGLAILLGTIGFLARSLVFILIGCFLIFVAWHRRVGGALRPESNLPASAVRAKMNKMNGEF